MKSRVAVMAIIVENSESVSKLNDLLHDSGDYILGRMGLPYKKRGINIISIALDAPEDVINTLAGKIGRLSGVTVKTAYSNASDTD
ncbi:MAG: iron-only hydrogenase system regulator [Eubacteriales bacterium]|nr:iron-only hydrogenase system regulator [Eubacteriales bacterium]